MSYYNYNYNQTRCNGTNITNQKPCGWTTLHNPIPGEKNFCYQHHPINNDKVCRGYAKSKGRACQRRCYPYELKDGIYVCELHENQREEILRKISSQGYQSQTYNNNNMSYGTSYQQVHNLQGPAQVANTNHAQVQVGYANQGAIQAEYIREKPAQDNIKDVHSRVTIPLGENSDNQCGYFDLSLRRCPDISEPGHLYYGQPSCRNHSKQYNVSQTNNKPDQSIQVIAKQEPIQTNDGKQEQPQGHDFKAEQIQVDDTKHEQIQVDDTKEKQVQVDDTKEKQVQVDDTKEKQVRVDDTREEQAQVDDTKQEQIQVDDTKHEQILVDDTKHEQILVDDTKHEPIQVDDTKQEQVQVDDTKEEQIQVDDTKEEQIQVDDAKEEQVQVDDTKHEQIQVDDIKQEEIHIEIFRQEQIQVDLASQGLNKPVDTKQGTDIVTVIKQEHLSQVAIAVAENDLGNQSQERAESKRRGSSIFQRMLTQLASFWHSLISTLRNQKTKKQKK